MNQHIDIPQENFDLIERYIFRELTSEEYDSFTLKLSTDEKLQQQVNTVRLLLLGVQEATLSSKIEHFHTSLPVSDEKNNRQEKGKVFSISKWLVAASVIVIIGIGSWLLFSISNKEEKLFIEYYSPDPGLISAMSTTDNYVYERAMIDYKTGDYNKAITAWEGLLTANASNDTLHYFIGSGYLAIGNSEKAITHFNKVISITNSYFIQDAYWYKGLALLKEGKQKEAIAFIEKTDHTQKTALLERLKK